MTDDVAHSNHHEHVRLLAGTNSSGRPVHELVPAVPVAADMFDIAGTPALALGCAAGDRVRVAADGTFEVVARGGNVGIVIFPQTPPDHERISALMSAFARLGGTTECHPDGRFVVVTVPVDVGFPSIEQRVQAWVADDEAGWCYTNVYDENDQPLNWWNEGRADQP